jgi:CRP-like cAMP-binding protein
MFRRTLSRDAVLWWQGDPAESVGVLERGRVGIRVTGQLVDIFPSGMAFGEAALLGAGSAVPRRGADIVVLDDDTMVAEYPIASLPNSMDSGVPQLILRTLVGQIGRNYLLAAATSPGNSVIEAMVAGSLEALARASGRIESVKAWEDFLAAFRFLYRLREGSDGLRALVGTARFSAAATFALLERLRPVLGGSALAADLDHFVRAEAARLAPV